MAKGRTLIQRQYKTFGISVLQSTLDIMSAYHKNTVRFRRHEKEDYYLLNGKRVSITSLLTVAKYMEFRVGRGYFLMDEITEDDYTYLQTELDADRMSMAAIILALGTYDITFRKLYKEHGTIKGAMLNLIVSTKRIPGGVTPKKYSNGTDSLTALGWVAKLGISLASFRLRTYKYGASSPITYMTVEEYSQLSEKEKADAQVGVKHGTATKIVIAEERSMVPATYRESCNLIARMIEDAKDNIVNNHKEYYDQSKRFLLNMDGNLGFLLEHIGAFSTKAAIKELQEFVVANDTHKTVDSTISV